jgi:oligopeptide/dipeptide ABC transporter ATP-binding protein
MPPDLSRAIEGCPFVARCDFAQEQCRQPVELKNISPDHATACARVQKGELNLRHEFH